MPYTPIFSSQLAFQEVRASALLPAAGAWDATPTELNVSALSGMLFFTYTQGDQAGAFEWQVQVSPYASAADIPAGAEEWLTLGERQAGVAAAGVDTTNLVQRGIQSYTSTGAGAEAFTDVLRFFAPVQRIRVPARETGVAGDPGTLQIQGMFLVL